MVIVVHFLKSVLILKFTACANTNTVPDVARMVKRLVRMTLSLSRHIQTRTERNKHIHLNLQHFLSFFSLVKIMPTLSDCRIS